MLQDWMAAMPKDGGTIALGCAIAGTLAGAGVWLAGARFSRSIVTLSLVTIGALLGMHLPAWMGWPLDSWAGGIGGAIVLGVSGFTMHRFWVGVGLGLVLAAWAAVATWEFGKGNAEIVWPSVEPTAAILPAYLADVWKALPADVTRIAPFMCGTAFVSGLIAALMWPRVGVILLYVLIGISLLVSMGLMCVEIGRPQLMQLVPSSLNAQLMMLGLLVLIGSLVQWKVTSRSESGAAAA
jgi:hypothetical protein